MRKKGFAHDPLLYLDQPDIHKPKASMQDLYKTPSRPQADAAGKRIKSPTSFRRSQAFGSTDQIPDEDAFAPIGTDSVVDDESLEEASDDLKDDKDSLRRKPFKEMTLDEKVNYLANATNHIPSVRCEVKTKEKNYRGIIMSREEDVIVMRIGKRRLKIQMGDIENVRLLGF
ncbi:MAG TPA: CotO family spore coat protein [Bacillota bacterium]|nr:CotO family spore coat protein [Bacillota bacterium]